MDPQQQALNNQVSGLDVIKELKETDQEIIADLEGLKIGQKTLEDKVDAGFAKGKDRMDGLEEMFKDHINTTKENHKEGMNALSDLKTEIKDNKIKDMAQDSKQKQDEFKSYKDKVWNVVKTIVVGIIMLVIGSVLGKLFG